MISGPVTRSMKRKVARLVAGRNETRPVTRSMKRKVARLVAGRNETRPDAHLVAFAKTLRALQTGCATHAVSTRLLGIAAQTALGADDVLRRSLEEVPELHVKNNTISLNDEQLTLIKESGDYEYFESVFTDAQQEAYLRDGTLPTPHAPGMCVSCIECWRCNCPHHCAACGTRFMHINSDDTPDGGVPCTPGSCELVFLCKSCAPLPRQCPHHK